MSPCISYNWFTKWAKIMFLPAVLVLIEEATWGCFWFSIFRPISIMLFIAYIAFNSKQLSCIFKTDYSYIMYLVHFPLIQLMVSLGYFVKHSEVAIALTIIASFFIAKYSECVRYVSIHKGISFLTGVE